MSGRGNSGQGESRQEGRPIHKSLVSTLCICTVSLPYELSGSPWPQNLRGGGSEDAFLEKQA